MQSLSPYHLKTCSYNMFGFNNGLSMLNNLCKNFDVILLQEHWLTSNDLSKLNYVNINFTSFGVSAMNSKIEGGIFNGRPFGGTAFLVKSNLLRYFTVIEADNDSGRFLALRYCRNLVDLILINVYFPYFKSSSDYTIECCDLTAKLECIINNYPNSRVLIAGDFNFSVNNNSVGYNLFKHILDDFNLQCCDNLNQQLSINHTYRHNSLPNSSWIDHFLVSKELIDKHTCFDIIDDGSNLSDHLPISLSFLFTVDSSNDNDSPNYSKPSPVLRWDKADLNKYYLNTSFFLQNFQPLNFLNSCNACVCTDHEHLIDSYYENIVCALKSSDSNSIPRIPPKSLKNFWSPELDNLKQISIDLHNLWRMIGSPTQNSLINRERIKAKYTYKLAIKEAKNSSLRLNADKINSSFIEKDSSNFWKCWNSNYKNSTSTRSSPLIKGLSNHYDIANEFRSYYCTTFVNSSDDSNASDEFHDLLSNLSNSDNYIIPTEVSDIEAAVNQLSMKKSADPDELFAEHIIYSHPSIITHLKLLFNIMLKHSYVPKRS